jgi:hypothetical protein
MNKKYAKRCRRFRPNAHAPVNIRTIVAASLPISVNKSGFLVNMVSKSLKGNVKPSGWKITRRYTTTVDSMYAKAMLKITAMTSRFIVVLRGSAEALSKFSCVHIVIAFLILSIMPG